MIRFFIILILCISISVADNEIDLLINNIKNAPISQKRDLMNQLKKKLRNYNAKKRLETINKLNNNTTNSYTYQDHKNIRIRKSQNFIIRSYPNIKNRKQTRGKQ